MIGVGVGVGIDAGHAALSYADAALALDFKNGIYRGATGLVAGVSSLPGYTYTRSGVKSEQDAASTALVSFGANLPGIVPGLGFWSRTAASNIFLNSPVGATQNITVSAQGYTLSFFGTGTITLSGASTAGPLVGTGANNRVSLSFTATAGTLTVSVSGSCTHVGVVPGSFLGPIIDTGGVNATVGSDALTVTNPVSAPFTMVAEFAVPLNAGNLLLIGLDDGSTANRIHLRTSASATGLNTLVVAASTPTRSFDQALAVTANTLLKAALRVKADGHTTLAYNGALVGAEQAAITMPTANLLTKVSVGSGPGSNPLNGYLSRAFLYSGTDTDAQLIARTV